MLKQSIWAVVFLLTAATLIGCGDGGNRIVEQPDPEQLEAKQQEFAEFQKKMAQQSKLPGQR